VPRAPRGGPCCTGPPRGRRRGAAPGETTGTGSADAPLPQARGGHGAGSDALPGLQARARAAPTTPLRPGGPARREHASIRHGTRRRRATRHGATGAIRAPALGPTRTEGACAAQRAQGLAPAPDACWRALADNRNTHQSAALVRLVAARCGLAADLGVHGQSGLRRSHATRGDPAPRRQFRYPPKHPSRRNQRARWFGLLARRVRKRGNFAALDALRERLPEFIAYDNRTAAPCKWTDKGRPLRR